ncbi:MAG: hypothetical protein GC159_01970 [Phycisphaera sp.]|nr:hypothetical protein [Phycisphaera sp.]
MSVERDEHLDDAHADELTALLGRYCDGTATSADHERLAELIRDDAEARRHYLRYMALHADLQWNATAEMGLPMACDAEQPETYSLSRALTGGADHSSGSAPALSYFAYFTRIAAAIVVVASLVVAVMALSRSGHNDGGDELAEVAPAMVRPTTVATVVDVTNAEWADEASADMLQPGTSLEPGALHLRRGSAQLVLGRGSIVTMLGDTKLEMIGDNACRLLRGRIAVYVPEWAIGFTVHTPSAMVTDLGTEFGVEVDGNDRTEVHVFQGIVEVGSADGDVSEAQRLTKGQARMFGPTAPTGGQVVSLRPARFEHDGHITAPLPDGVVRVRGAVHSIDAPPSLARGRFEHNARIALIPERQGVKLVDPLTVTFPRRPGLWATSDSGNFVIAPGKKVDVFLLHFDPVGTPGNDKSVSLAGSVRFDRPILGVIASDEHLQASDELLGLPNMIYDATPNGGRGFDGGFSDSLTISADRKELFLQLTATGAIDQVRVLVVSK